MAVAWNGINSVLKPLQQQRRRDTYTSSNNSSSSVVIRRNSAVAGGIRRFQSSNSKIMSQKAQIIEDMHNSFRDLRLSSAGFEKQQEKYMSLRAEINEIKYVNMLFFVS